MKTVTLAICMLLLPALGLAANADNACKDFKDRDFKNARLNDGELTMDFKDGVAKVKETPASGYYDWIVTIKREFIMQPRPEVYLRGLYIDKKHLAGNADVIHPEVMLFRCVDGKTRLLGVWDWADFRDVSDTYLSLDQALPRSKKKKELILKWDSEIGHLVRVRNIGKK